MKKIAVVIYEGFCMFEFSVVLETLAISAEFTVDVYGEERKAFRSEEGLLCCAEYTLEEMNVNDYEGIILTGFENEEIKIINNPRFLEMIREFDQAEKVIGAISAAPVFLVKAGILHGLRFMCACSKEGLFEEGFTQEDLEGMFDWEEGLIQYERVKFIRQGHIITSMAYGFREWAMEIGKMLSIEVYPKTFGLAE